MASFPDGRDIIVYRPAALSAAYCCKRRASSGEVFERHHEKFSLICGFWTVIVAKLVLEVGSCVARWLSCCEAVSSACDVRIGLETFEF